MRPSSSLEALEPRASALRGALRTSLDFASMTRPRIGAFVFFSAFTGALLAEGPGAALGPVGLAAFLIMLVAASSSVFNQVLERDLDRLMRRTENRPLPAARLSVKSAVAFGSVLGIAGVVGLALSFGSLAALLALSTLAAYVLVYTPLKRHSSFHTLVGAVPGAMPPLLGYAALGGEAGSWGWMLFGVVFAWQFPHFLAIGWLHREDYRRAGVRVLAALPGAEGSTGRQALLHALLLLPVSLLPCVRGEAGVLYALVALACGAGYALASALFAWRETARAARWVLFTSLVYLPVLFTAVLFDPTASRVLTP